MDIFFAEAVTHITALPQRQQRAIAVQLLGLDANATLPVIEFEAD
ncbi:MAG: hypothetical protein AAFZ99_15450 [Pseudomonadota bacterium]